MVFIPLNFQSETNVFRSAKFPIGNQCVRCIIIFPYIFCFSPFVTLVDTRHQPVMVCPIFIETNSTELFEKNAVDVFNVSKRKAAEKRCFNS